MMRFSGKPAWAARVRGARMAAGGCAAFAFAAALAVAPMTGAGELDDNDAVLGEIAEGDLDVLTDDGAMGGGFALEGPEARAASLFDGAFAMPVRSILSDIGAGAPLPKPAAIKIERRKPTIVPTPAGMGLLLSALMFFAMAIWRARSARQA